MLENLWKPRKNEKIQAAAVASANNRTTHLPTKFIEITAAPTGGTIKVISLLHLHPAWCYHRVSSIILLVAVTVLVLSYCWCYHRVSSVILLVLSPC